MWVFTVYQTNQEWVAKTLVPRVYHNTDFSINVEGPEHYVLAIHDYPEKPFDSGCFQLAFKAVVISAGGKFLSKDKQYVLKQHHLQDYGLIEDCESTSGPSDLSEEFLEQPRIANEKKTTKVTFMYSVILGCYP